MKQKIIAQAQLEEAEPTVKYMVEKANHLDIINQVNQEDKNPVEWETIKISIAH